MNKTKTVTEIVDSRNEVRSFNLSILTENKSGLLNAVTIIFTRRKINIESINVSETEVEGVSRYTIVIESTREKVEKVVKRIRKLIDVFWAFVYEEDEIYYQEIALYKVPTKVFLDGDNAEHLVRNNGARILVIEEDFIIIEKTGHQHETKDLLEKLKPFGVLEFVRSGRVAMSKSTRRTDLFLRELHNHH
ncbi:MAG: acetolactate synthase small subunit [Cyclobacteriaceae bacterium]|nr:MAG: acetolactate synthase small subunit [Cyclobacteriaceae bacterium]